MERQENKVKNIASLLTGGHWGVILNPILEGLYSTSTIFGLHRDLTVPFEAPSANIPLKVRPMIDSDASALLDIDAAGLASGAIRERWERLQLLEAHIPTCYAAVTPDGTPCYMQWLIMPSENGKIQAHFGALVPQLAPDEALLEGAFTPEAFRGQRIMPCAMAELAKKAGDLGARWVITFVSHDNIPSLKGCKRAGFAPFLIRKDEWRLFRRRTTFTPLPGGTPYPFDLEQTASRKLGNSPVGT